MMLKSREINNSLIKFINDYKRQLKVLINKKFTKNYLV